MAVDQATVDLVALLAARMAVCDAVKAWRDARCQYRRPIMGHDDVCIGENHLENCPCEGARQDLLAAHDALEQLRTS